MNTKARKLLLKTARAAQWVPANNPRGDILQVPVEGGPTKWRELVGALWNDSCAVPKDIAGRVETGSGKTFACTVRWFRALEQAGRAEVTTL